MARATADRARRGPTHERMLDQARGFDSFGLGFDTALLSAAWGNPTASNYLCPRSRSKQTIGATEP